MLQRFDKTLKVPDFFVVFFFFFFFFCFVFSYKIDLSRHTWIVYLLIIFIYMHVLEYCNNYEWNEWQSRKKYGIKIFLSLFVYLLERFDISTFTCNMRWKIENWNRKLSFPWQPRRIYILNFKSYSRNIYCISMWVICIILCTVLMPDVVDRVSEHQIFVFYVWPWPWPWDGNENFAETIFWT